MPTRLDVPVAGGTLAAFRLAASGAEPEQVLAIHGITANAFGWIAVARALGERASLVAVDLRGRGDSRDLVGPYGLDAHDRDMSAVLDHCGIEHGVVVGHSLGAYIAARLAVEHPDRVRAAVLVDGGLPLPVPADADPQALLDASIGPAVARLRMRFASAEEYRDWWRAHPAFARSDVADDDLVAYADHDLTGEPPELRSSVSEEAVRADAAALFTIEDYAASLRVPAALLCAPRGFVDDPNPFQPFDRAQAWAGAAPQLREVIAVPDVNHYSIALGQRGARAIADAVAAALTR